MPTMIMDARPGPDGMVVRCNFYPGWRPKPVPVLDRAEMEKQLRSYQTRHTAFEWYVWPGQRLENLGFDRSQDA